MGLIDSKKNIFTTIGAYTSMMQSGTLPEQTNIFPSINNKKDIVPLLLDILKVVVGSTALQELTGQLFTRFVDTAEPQLKVGLKKQVIQFNSGDGLPAEFKTNGYSVAAKDIDIFGKLNNPDTSTISLLYSNNANNFDNVALNAIKNPGTDNSFGNLLINYNSITDSFIFKPNLTINANPSIGEWCSTFVDNAEIINKKEFMSTVMNSFYGSITKNQKKSVEEVYQELQVNKLIEQLINDDDSFVILPEDYDAMLQKAQELVNGVLYYDLGCGVMPASLPLSGMTDVISNISGSTDPFYIGNQVAGTIEQSTSNTQAASTENQQTIKDNFFQRLIKLITQMLANFVTTSPQIRALLAITSAFQNNDVPQIGNPLDDLKKFRVYLNCIIKDAMKMINKFIFDLVIAFLIALLNPVIRKIIKEKINQYIGVIKSLTVGSATIT